MFAHAWTRQALKGSLALTSQYTRIVFPFDVREAAVRVACDCFWWKRDLRDFMLGHGIPADFYDRRAQGSKGQFIPLIFGDLSKHGDGGEAILWKVTRALSCLDGAVHSEMDDAVAKASIDKLRRLLQRDHASSPDSRRAAEESAVKLRAEAEQQRQAAAARQQVRERFNALLTHPDAQERGREFQPLIQELFEANGIKYEPAFRVPAQEIDGKFEFQNKHFLVEVRWRKEQADLALLAAFKAKVDRKLDGTLGLYISMSGFGSDAVESLLQGARRNILLLDGINLIQVIEERITLADALTKMISDAAKRGTIVANLIA